MQDECLHLQQLIFDIEPWDSNKSLVGVYVFVLLSVLLIKINLSIYFLKWNLALANMRIGDLKEQNISVQ